MIPPGAGAAGKGILHPNTHPTVPELYLGFIANGGQKTGQIDIDLNPPLAAGAASRVTLDASRTAYLPARNVVPGADVFWARAKSGGVSDFPEIPAFPGTDPAGTAPKHESNVSVFFNIKSQKPPDIQWKGKSLASFDPGTRSLQLGAVTLDVALIGDGPTDPRYAGDPLLGASLEIDPHPRRPRRRCRLGELG